MVDRSSRCYSWGSDFFFCKEIIFVTKYRIQSHVKRRFLLYMLLFWKKTKMWNSFINREFKPSRIRQTSYLSWEFLKIENEQIKTAQKLSYG